MPVIEMKEKPIAKIGNINDEDLLDQISRFVDLDEQTYPVYKLNPQEKEAVKEGIAQIENGQWFTNEEANKIFDKCLGR